MGQSAPLIPLTLIGPGFAGLNTQTSSTVLGPEWASEALNMVFDESGRPAARKGWVAITAEPLESTPDIEQLHEFVDLAGNRIIVSAANNKLYSGTAFTDVTGDLEITANNWQFANFYGKVYALQSGHPLVSWNGTGDFDTVTPLSGSVPDGNCLLSAFGRLWGTSSDGQTLKYCTLLNGESWGATGSGSYNFTQVWGDGLDTIQALAAFNNFLVVFGKRHIILIADESGSTLGLDPNNSSVVDTIVGVGCYARDSVQNVDGDDLVFLSHTGLQSLRRVVEAKGNPLRDISTHVRDAVVGHAALASSASIRSTYNPREGFYLLLIPEASTIYCFNTKMMLEDGSWRVTKWNHFVPKCLLTLDDRATLYSAKDGTIYRHASYLDATLPYRFAYNSGWLSVSPEVQDRLKILKRIGSILAVGGQTNVIFRWGFDFRNFRNSLTKSTAAGQGGGEWGTGEWGESIFGTLTGLNEFEIPAWGTGQFIKIGVESDINNTQFAIQQLQLFAKVGRIT